MNIFSRENSSVLRGLAILAIMFHNYLHLSIIGFSKENEMSFSEDLSQSFYTKLFSCDSNVIAELVSFLGWTGVSVFVFLSGYGLMMKYSKIPDIWIFIKHNYLKLFWLLLPAILFFFVTDIYSAKISHLPKRLIYLTMLQNLDYPDFRVDPGVYWYFSLTFQFYLFFALTRRWINIRFLLVFSILSLVGLWALEVLNIPHFFSIFRHCFTGWFPVFALGIFYAMQDRRIEADRLSPFLDLAIAVILLAAMLLLNENFHIWLFLPIVGLYFFFVLAKLIIRAGGQISYVFSWIGKYSAGIFVCHPIVRALSLVLYARFNHLWIITLLYFVLTPFW